MKKTILFNSLVLCCLSLQAETVDCDIAQATARAFLASRGVAMVGSQQPYKAPRRGKSADGSPAYYVFNAGNDNGYVFVSADSRTDEILGYVDHGSFDETALPDNARAYLQMFADEQRILDENHISEADVRKAPRRIHYARHYVPEILKCRWGQGAPYNLLVPDYYNEDGTMGHSNTGCPSTAMSQVLYHYKWPQKTIATIPAHTCQYTLKTGERKSITQPEIPAGTEIDWDHMLDTYDDSSDSVSRYAVAKLLLITGQMIGTSYSSLSGGASAIYHGAVKTYLGFDESVRWIDRRNYDYEEWIDEVYNELSAGYPMLIQGLRAGGGHSFIIDGYDGEGLFHVNWGWDGSSNGWFKMSSLGTAGMDAYVNAADYTLHLAGLINLRIKDDIPDLPARMMDLSDIVLKNNSLTATFRNITGAKNNFQVALTLYDRENREYVPVGSPQSVLNLEPDARKTFTFNLRRVLSEGVYELHPAARLISGGPWKPCLNTTNDFIEATVNAYGLATLKRTGRTCELVVDDFSFPGTCKTGENQHVLVTFSNPGREFYRELTIYTGQNGQMTRQNSLAAVQVPENGSTTVCFNFTPDATGTYDVWVCSDNGQTVYAKSTVNITKVGVKNQMRVSGIRIQNSVGGTVCGNRLYGSATIFNQMPTAFSGLVYVQLWIQDEHGIWWGPGPTELSNITVGPSKSISVPFHFRNLQYRSYCMVVGCSDQNGYLDNAGKYNHVFAVKPGITYWKNTGDLVALESKASLSVPRSAAGVLVNSEGLRQMTANTSNPNTLFVFDNAAELPNIFTAQPSLNIVRDNRADTIRLRSGYPYYTESTFTARHATFSHTFSSPTTGTGWETLMLPFRPTSITIDSLEYQLSAEDNPFWIYQFTHVDNAGSPVFQPASELLGHLPYLIAADASLLGHTITFASDEAEIPGASEAKPIFSSELFTMRGSTCQQSVRGAYVLNDQGTAFVLTSESKTVPPLQACFETTLPDSLRPAAIELPPVPRLTKAGAPRPAAGSRHNSFIYDLSGRMISTEKLPGGIYIINGRKVRVP